MLQSSHHALLCHRPATAHLLLLAAEHSCGSWTLKLWPSHRTSCCRVQGHYKSLLFLISCPSISKTFLLPPKSALEILRETLSSGERHLHQSCESMSMMALGWMGLWLLHTELGKTPTLASVALLPFPTQELVPVPGSFKQETLRASVWLKHQLLLLG